MSGWGCFCDAAVLQNGLVLILTVLVVNVAGQCSNPPSVQHAVLNDQSQLLNDFPEGTTVTYECNPGYRRVSGSPSISCSNSQWSQPTLTCEKKSCGSPGEILNGKYDLSEGILFGARARVICDEGYQLVGRERLCLANGWSSNVPLCEVVKCEEPPDIGNGTHTYYGGSVPYGSAFRYTCNKGFTLIGEEEIVCGRDGNYNPPPPQCKVVSCPDVSITNGKKVSGRLPPYGYKSFITFECDSGHKVNGTLTITCGVNGWSSEPPTCYRVAAPTTTTPTQSTSTESGVSSTTRPITVTTSRGTSPIIKNTDNDLEDQRNKAWAIGLSVGGCLIALAQSVLCISVVLIL
ncbi:C4b-binding protein alpha chain-like isoform X3 [Lepisosteus oculatus]|uniref:C4b-binding protein alpha chain-like isoform X3 n=1 Tax=Lepisosteus oculatus TaxID=7918 RepID=UPI0037223CF6